MDNVSKLNFRAFNLDSMFSLKGVRMDWDLFHASLKFWDPEDHVFRFNMDEICPTIEDFSAILGIDSNLPTVIPTLQNSYTSSIVKLFNLPIPIILRMLFGEGINLLSLFEEFAYQTPTSVQESHRKNSALALTYVGEFLLVNQRSGFADVRISTLIPQLLGGKSLVPIVIAESMNGLDAVYRDETDIFRGSPLLLQVWLMDCLP